MSDIDDRRDLSVLREKRDATRYRILVEIAERQPAVSQSEIAGAIGVTAQAVSEYVGDMVEEGFVEKRARGRYRVTKEGVDWLISRTDELRRFTEYVSEEVVGDVEVDAAIALDSIEAGETVSLSMREGFLHATPGDAGEATAVAVADATAGESVGVTDFEGILEYEPGTVTVLAVPPVSAEASVDRDLVSAHLEDAERVAVDGTEAYAAALAAGRDPDVQFGAASAVPEAAARGLDVVLLAVAPEVSSHTERLRDDNLTCEVVDVAA